MNSLPSTPPDSSTATSISRRRFLAQTGLGLAAVSTLSAATAFGSSANSKVRLGLIGCGGRGSWIASLFYDHSGYQIAGAADYFEDRAKDFAEKFQLQPGQVFTGLKCYEKMIAKGGLDAVAIISPPYFHPEQARAAVEAGLNVYVAKPLAVDVPGVQSIRESGELARKKGQVFLVDFQTRANEFFVEAMKRVHSGAIGEIAFGESSYHCGRLNIKGSTEGQEGRIRNWAFDKALSGDIIVEQNIHTLDVMNWAMKHAAPLHCTGTGGRKVRVDVGDCWDYFTLVFEYPNNVGISFSSRQFEAHGTPGGILNRMFGTKGALLTEYGGNVLIRGGKDTFYRGGNTGAIYKEGAQANIKTFHELLAKKDASNPTIEPSVMSNLIAIMGRTAAYEHRTVTWDEVIKSTKKIDANLKGLKA